MNGKGLIFAMASHKRAAARQVQVGPYRIRIPPRAPSCRQAPTAACPAEQAAVLAALEAWLTGRQTG